MMRQHMLIFVCAVCAPLGADAQRIALNEGVYDAFDCSVQISDQRIEITGNHLVFYESSCDISNPQFIPGLERTRIYDAACQGEGETWTTRFILMQTQDGGLAVMGEIWGDHYLRCD